jgi:hypothetical protein
MRITEADVEFTERSRPDYLGYSWPGPEWSAPHPVKIRVTFLARSAADFRVVQDFLRRSVEVQVVPVEAEPAVVTPSVVETVSCEVEEVKALPPVGGAT